MAVTFTIGLVATMVCAALAAPYDHGGHGVVPGPAVEHAYLAEAPVVKCGHNLLLSCGTHHTAIPCKAEHHKGYHHEAPAYHGHAPAYHHAAPAHHEAAHYAPAHHAPAHYAPEHGYGGEYRAKGKKKHHKKGKSAVVGVERAMDDSSQEK